MSSILKKIVNKSLNLIFKFLYKINYSTYKATLSNRSFDSMSAVLLWMVQGVKKEYPDFRLTNKNVLEVGSGQFLSHPLGLKILGAREVISIDLFRQFNQKAAMLSFQQNVMAKKIFCGEVHSGDYNQAIQQIQKSNLDLGLLEDIGIKYIAPMKLLDYSNHEDFELVISYTTLEHIPPNDIPLLFEKSVELLKKDGVFCHFIDLEDHKDSEKNPFEFLQYSNWTNLNCFSRGNRMRPSEWKDLLDKIDNIEYKFTYVLERDKDLLPKSIEKISDNYASGILLIGKKLK